MPGQPSRSLYLEYGGDFVVSPQGGLLIAEDSVEEATSSNQRVQRLLLTNPQIKDENGNVVARGDCYEYQTYGVGIKRLVDEAITTPLLRETEAKIQNQLAQDPGLLSSPSPIIAFTQSTGDKLAISVQFTTNSGQVFSTPALPISGG